MPFYLIPGDLLLLSPLYLASPTTYQRHGGHRGQWWVDPMAARVGDPIRPVSIRAGARDRRHVLRTGVRGRALLAPGATPGEGPRVINFKSTYLEFPIVEYRPYRAFDTTQTSALILQLFGGVDIPSNEGVAYPPGAPNVDLDPVYSIGVRLVFDWRAATSLRRWRVCRRERVSHLAELGHG